jgi:uncharacterized damage-inducible protein DinB
MTNIYTIISKINRELISAFASLDAWFDHDHEFLSDNSSGGWSAAQILEHVMLTNHYLLILIKKGTRKANEVSAKASLQELINDYEFENNALNEVGIYKSFRWERPEHMEPKGNHSLTEIRDQLRDQLYQCLCCLDELADGQGVLYRMTMTVNNIGKLDVYQYLYFLALHIRRHIAQLEKRPNYDLCD